MNSELAPPKLPPASPKAAKGESLAGARSRFARAPKGGLQLNERDEALLCDLFLFRVLSREQIQRLHFGSVPRANARLRKLFDFGFVHRHYLALAPWGSPALYFPAIAAVPAIARELERRGLEVEPGEIARVCRINKAPAFLEHTLAVAGFTLDLRDEVAKHSTLEIDLWLPEVMCRHEYEIEGPRGLTREVFKPDGFVRLAFTDRPARPAKTVLASAFVEIDLGHVSSALFRAKWGAYRRYAQSGLFAHGYGDTQTAGEPLFRVLVVTTGTLRLSHLKAVVEEAMRECGESAKAPLVEWCFSTAAQVEQQGALGDHWQRPFHSGHFGWAQSYGEDAP